MYATFVEEATFLASRKQILLLQQILSVHANKLGNITGNSVSAMFGHLWGPLVMTKRPTKVRVQLNTIF